MLKSDCQTYKTQLSQILILISYFQETDCYVIGGNFKAGNQNRLTLCNRNSIDETGNNEESVDRVGDDEAEALLSLDEDQTQGHS